MNLRDVVVEYWFDGDDVDDIYVEAESQLSQYSSSCVLSSRGNVSLFVTISLKALYRLLDDADSRAKRIAERTWSTLQSCHFLHKGSRNPPSRSDQRQHSIGVTDRRSFHSLCLE